jgi:hypothetical protein
MSINRAERSLGLIDGVYGVAVTLVAIDVPKILMPYIRSGDFLTMEPVFYLASYVFQFLLMYDMWMIHKNISMRNEHAFSKKSEFISMAIMGLVILSPGLVGDAFSIFENSDDLQSPELNIMKICFYFYVVSIYGLLILMDLSKGNKIQIRPFLFNGLLFRFVIFFIALCVSLVSNLYGWVLPVPAVVLLMMLSNTFLSHPEYETEDSRWS